MPAGGHVVKIPTYVCMHVHTQPLGLAVIVRRPRELADVPRTFREDSWAAFRERGSPIRPPIASWPVDAIGATMKCRAADDGHEPCRGSRQFVRRTVCPQPERLT